MKVLCISTKRFSQTIGYSLWGLALIGLITILVASSIELQNVYELKSSVWSHKAWCYDSMLNGETQCYHWFEHNLTNRNYASTVMVIIHIIISCLWVYYKQDKFKFRLCDKTGFVKDDLTQHSHDNVEVNN